MKYLVSLIATVFLVVLQASSNYPMLYSTQGTPLYKSLNEFSSLQKLPSLTKVTTDYITKANLTRKMGIKADISYSDNDIKTYLKALRSLQNIHDQIVKLSIKELRDSIKEDDYQKFLEIVNIGMEYYSIKPILHKDIVSYYKANKSQGRSKIIDKVIKDDKYIVKNNSNRYKSNTKKREYSTSKKIILLSRPGCGWCVKAKKLLNSSGKRYTEYNVEKPTGTRLFKKYKGSGVPMIIVGDKVIKGYSESGILAALK
jgi:glutaredoxin